jgi:hypothetical protein
MALPDYITHHFWVSIVAPAPCSAGRRIILRGLRALPQIAADPLVPAQKNIATAALE